MYNKIVTGRHLYMRILVLSLCLSNGNRKFVFLTFSLSVCLYLTKFDITKLSTLITLERTADVLQ